MPGDDYVRPQTQLYGAINSVRIYNILFDVHPIGGGTQITRVSKPDSIPWLLKPIVALIQPLRWRTQAGYLKRIKAQVESAA